MIDLKCMPAFFKVDGNIAHHVKIKFRKSFFLYLRFLLLAFVLALNCQPAYGAEVSMAWDSTNEAMGYKLYYGFESRNYQFVVDIGLSTQCTISDLDLGQIYYFAVTAYNEHGESDFSWELEYTFDPCSADADIDGDIDGSDLADIIADPSATTIGDFAARFGAENCDNVTGD